MISSKRMKIDSGQFTLLSGKTKYEVEVPFAEHIDVWVEWKCDKEVTAWLYFANGITMPYAVATSGHFNVQTNDLLSIVLTTEKSATLCVAVSTKDLSKREKLDYTPVEIAPPAPGQLQLASVLTAEVRRQLAAMGVLKDTVIDVDEEDDLEDDLPEEDDQGEGYMDVEEPTLEKKKKAKPEPASPSNPPGDVDPGGNASGPSEPPEGLPPS